CVQEGQTYYNFWSGYMPYGRFDVW
nr:immunoglobulin heavy chain junction region [Macaca mulatta]MOX96884.1 immunoglobulin heavy chain junction region [Macaca mulatta]